jgi:hypothetical protein
LLKEPVDKLEGRSLELVRDKVKVKGQNYGTQDNPVHHSETPLGMAMTCNLWGI